MNLHDIKIPFVMVKRSAYYYKRFRFVRIIHLHNTRAQVNTGLLSLVNWMIKAGPSIFVYGTFRHRKDINYYYIECGVCVCVCVCKHLLLVLVPKRRNDNRIIKLGWILTGTEQIQFQAGNQTIYKCLPSENVIVNMVFKELKLW